LLDFSSDREFGREASPKIVAMRQARQCVEARQRDIYDSHRHRTFALAYYMTGNEVEAEEILSKTFVRAFRAAEEPDGQEVDSALLDELRLRSYLQLDVSGQFSEASIPPSSTELAGRNVKRTDLEEAIRDLPAAERFVFLLRDVEGYTPSSIAQLLDMPEEQVQHGLFAARLRLRQILAEAQADAKERAA
jgi:RNA polymerase sigma-70 factor, ECF subfamily